MPILVKKRLPGSRSTLGMPLRVRAGAAGPRMTASPSTKNLASTF
jgi:hypothetical protein